MLFGASILALPQNDYRGTVLDDKSSLPIPFVNIGIIAEGKGTVSDNQGFFQLKRQGPNDIISFSSIGYETKEITGDQLIKTHDVRLVPKVYQIPEIEVTSKQFNGEERIFGVRNETRGHSVGFAGAQLGTEIGALIYLDKPTLVKSAHFVINHAKGDSMLFRLNIYDYHDKQIGKNLLQENIFIRDKQRKGTINIDLTPYELILSRSVLLSLEWLRNFDEIGNKDMTFDTRKGKKLKGIFYKLSSNGAFERLPYKQGSSTCFYFMGKQTE